MTEEKIFNRIPPNTKTNKFGETTLITPNQEVFDRKSGVYWLTNYVGDYICISSRRDRLLHLTLWRMMDRHGSSIEVDWRIIKHKNN